MFGPDIEKYLQHVYANEWGSQSVSHYKSLYKQVALIKTANVGLTGQHLTVIVIYDCTVNTEPKLF